MIDRSAWRGIELVARTCVLVTSVVVTSMTSCDYRFRLAVRVPGDRMGCGQCVNVRAVVRSTLTSNRTCGEMQDPEGDQGPQGEANAHRPQTGDPPLTRHAATLATAQGHRTVTPGLSTTLT